MFRTELRRAQLVRLLELQAARRVGCLFALQALLVVARALRLIDQALVACGADLALTSGECLLARLLTRPALLGLPARRALALACRPLHSAGMGRFRGWRSDRFGQDRSVQVIVLIGRQTLQVEQVETLYNKELDISMVVSGSDRSPNSEALRQIVAEVKGGEVAKTLFPVEA